jgi:hypothetical protein
MNQNSDQNMKQHLASYDKLHYSLEDCEKPRKPLTLRPVAGAFQTPTSSHQYDHQNNREPSQVPIKMSTVATLISKKYNTWLWNGLTGERRLQTISLARRNSEREEIASCRPKRKWPGSERIKYGLRQCTKNVLSLPQPPEQAGRHRYTEMPVFCGLLTVCHSENTSGVNPPARPSINVQDMKFALPGRLFNL